MQEEEPAVHHSQKSEKLQDQIDHVKKKIIKYLERGFIFAYNYDLTSNLQRQRALYEQYGFEAKDKIKTSFSWNESLFQEFRVQNVPERWFTHLIQGSVDRHEI